MREDGDDDADHDLLRHMKKQKRNKISTQFQQQQQLDLIKYIYQINQI